MCVPDACVPEKSARRAVPQGQAAGRADGRKRMGTAAFLLRCDVRPHVACVNGRRLKSPANALMQINYFEGGGVRPCGGRRILVRQYTALRRWVRQSDLLRS